MEVLLCLQNIVLSKYLYFNFHHHFSYHPNIDNTRLRTIQYILYNGNSAIYIHILSKVCYHDHGDNTLQKWSYIILPTFNKIKKTEMHLGAGRK